MFNKILSSVAAIIATAGIAQAATLIDNSTQGYYNNGIGSTLNGTNIVGDRSMFPNGGDYWVTYNASQAPDLSTATSALGAWLTDPTNAGGTWSSAPVAIPTTWATKDEDAVIYELNGGSTGLANVLASITIDNGVYVWLNGQFIGGAMAAQNTDNTFTFKLGNLGAGANYLQLLREDHGGKTAYDISVTGDFVAPAAVPLPASGLLLAGAAAGLTALRRRRKA